LIVALTSGRKRRPRRTSLLGVENLRRSAPLTVLASIDGTPPGLTATATAPVRARFCELARGSSPGPRPVDLFRLGRFSVIDALMDAPIEDVRRARCSTP
jgi:c-di-GMP-related signal transduction protein